MLIKEGKTKTTLLLNSPWCRGESGRGAICIPSNRGGTDLNYWITHILVFWTRFTQNWE